MKFHMKSCKNARKGLDFQGFKWTMFFSTLTANTTDGLFFRVCCMLAEKRMDKDTMIRRCEVQTAGRIFKGQNQNLIAIVRSVLEFVEDVGALIDLIQNQNCGGDK